jgi:glyoxylase-like metal-dependent hydrolase (beta-lactamase superfamily II)
MPENATRPNHQDDPGAVQRQAWADNVLPPVERVAPGLWSIPVPIPDSPLRYVLVYAFELDDGVAIVDAGWDTEDAWLALTEGLVTIGASVQDVRAVLVTHIHPDHYGLAGRVREASGAWVGLHPADAELIGERYEDVYPLLEKTRALLRSCGVPDKEAADLAESSVPLRFWVQTVRPDRLISDGDRLELPGWDLQAIWTPGHSPGHLCFVEQERRLLLTGDCVLPRISPNVGVHPQQRPNPLAEFLDSLQRLGRYDPELVLPAHEYRFVDLHGRLDALATHHEHRLDEILARVIAEPGITCWQLTEQMQWSRPWSQINGFMRRAANGETLAHLELLSHQGRVERLAGTPITWVPGPVSRGPELAGSGPGLRRTSGSLPGCC